MERFDKIHKRDLAAEDFDAHPIWVWDDAHEGFHPVVGSGAFPGEFGTLFIKAVFETASGKELVGYLVGIETFYAFCLFVGGREHLVNLNLPDFAEAELKVVEAKIGGPIMPLNYQVEIVFDDQPQIKGALRM